MSGRVWQKGGLSHLTRLHHPCHVSKVSRCDFFVSAGSYSHPAPFELQQNKLMAELIKPHKNSAQYKGKVEE